MGGCEGHRYSLRVDKGKGEVRPYGHELVTLRCLGYFNITMMAATFTKARKLAAFFS